MMFFLSSNDSFFLLLTASSTPWSGQLLIAAALKNPKLLEAALELPIVVKALLTQEVLVVFDPGFIMIGGLLLPFFLTIHFHRMCVCSDQCHRPQIRQAQ